MSIRDGVKVTDTATSIFGPTHGASMLRCDREPDHGGIHRDDRHRAYFAPVVGTAIDGARS